MSDEDTPEIPAEPDKPKGPDDWPSIEQRPPFADVLGEESDPPNILADLEPHVGP